MHEFTFVIQDFLYALRNDTFSMKWSRRGWNGKDMYITLQRVDANSKMTLPYIYMKTATDSLVPWVASQTDLLSNDWEVYTSIEVQ